MFRNITLEMSLKPFRQTDHAYIEKVCRGVFEQWKPLVKDTETVSVLLWTADGSEILDYKGKLDDSFAWCQYVGSANPPESLSWDPQGKSLHARGRLYMDNPPQMTYDILKRIVSTLKKVGAELLVGKKIRVGETFDIGPEFARSSFKYERHTELLRGTAMGAKCFIDSNGTLQGDDYPYAGFPNGVPDGTPFGTFLGRQTNLFLHDMGFDYLWLSNGVGFSAQPWESRGPVFDGERFYSERLGQVRRQVFRFWELFRNECPNYPVETRGTNFSLGIDYATDAVPLYDLYNAGLNLLPPPNSPWAALDGNFGLELMGHMTRIAELPEDSFMFRYYLHDPWWVNSPWYDRYEGQPHDIYLPMAVGRIDENGKTKKPTHLSLLSIDNSWGGMPDACVNEPIPHILKACKDAPDAPAPITWIYPFSEYATATDKAVLHEMFSNDWFICGAINHSVPVSAVVSTNNFIKTDKEIYTESILLSPVPEAGSRYEDEIIRYAKCGGQVLFYGGVERASERFLQLVNLRLAEGVEGDLLIERNGRTGKIEETKGGRTDGDSYTDGQYPKQIHYDAFLCAGKLNTLLADSTSPVRAICTAAERVLCTFGRISGANKSATSNGNVGWFRAPLGSSYQKGKRLLTPHDPRHYLHGEDLFRTVLEQFGFSIRLSKPSVAVKSPVIMVNRSDNGFFFSSYLPSTTVETRFKLPQGAPLLLGYETVLQNGYSSYRLPRAEHRECRVFVEQQEDTLLSCREIPPTEYDTRRRLEVTGLEDATVRFYPESYAIGNCQITLNPPDGIYYATEPIDPQWKGNCCEMRHVTGRLVLAMYRKSPDGKRMDT